MSEINRNDWLKALADVAPPPKTYDPEALTAEEFGKLFGCSACTARVRLRALVAEGRVVRVTKLLDAADGRRLPVNAYRLKP